MLKVHAKAVGPNLKIPNNDVVGSLVSQSVPGEFFPALCFGATPHAIRAKF